MKRWVWLALTAGATYGATALGQSTANPNTSPEDQLRARHAQAQLATAAQPGEMQTLSGTVKSYKPGKKIVVTDASGKNHSMKLDESARVDTTSLNPGDSVTVMWMTDSAGKERVTSVSTSGATGTSMSGTTGTTGSTGTTGTTSMTSPRAAVTPGASSRYGSTSGATGSTGTVGSTSNYSGSSSMETGSAASPSSSMSGVNGQMSSSTPSYSGTPGASMTGTPGMDRMRTTPRTTRTPGAAGSDTGTGMQPTPIPK